MIKNNRKGFTLIELLVVVLIIGILSSVALPQYMKTVEKARFAEAAELLQAVAGAEQRYRLQHGEFAENFEDLDIELIGSKASAPDIRRVAAAEVAERATEATKLPEKVKDTKSIQSVNKDTMVTDNFHFSLASVNKDGLIEAGRGNPGDKEFKYVLYKNILTGGLFCEDEDTEDNIRCSMFATSGDAFTCGDGSVSLTGEGGCKEEEEEVKEPQYK